MRGRLADESGTIVLWLLGLSLLLLAAGGIAVDLWRATGERRAIATLADAAAHAGASGLDVEAFRAGNGVQLAPERAEALAVGALTSAPNPAGMTGFDVAATSTALRVTVEGEVSLTLLRLLTGDESLDVAVTSVAAPRRVP